MKNIIFLFVLVMGFSLHAYETANMVSGIDNSTHNVEEIIKNIEPGTIIILGENHATRNGDNIDQRNQLEFIQNLLKTHSNVSVGMEFIDYTKQSILDQYLRNEMDEATFLQEVHWGGSPYESYKGQILSSLNGSAWTYAINAPRSLTRAIAKKGLAGLNTDELSLMPPHFQLGSALYRKRFFDLMGVPQGGHSEKLENYFAAQSTWDDTMAWQATEIMNQDPEQIMVIIVGNFHASYGGGLADRLIARGHNKILNIVQAASMKLSDEERSGFALPHPEYGVIADYVW